MATLHMLAPTSPTSRPLPGDNRYRTRLDNSREVSYEKQNCPESFGTGHLATPNGRSTHSRRVQSFDRICQITLMHDHLIHDSLAPLDPPHQAASGSPQPFFSQYTLVTIYLSLSVCILCFSFSYCMYVVSLSAQWGGSSGIEA